jgi:adenine-specific DNA-methyltransferase
LEERLYLCRELLTEAGSIFVQISDENVHAVRQVMEEVFGRNNFCALIPFAKTAGQSSNLLPSVCDYLVWFAKSLPNVWYAKLYSEKEFGQTGATKYQSILLSDGTKRALTPEEREERVSLPPGARLFTLDNLKSQGFRTGTTVDFRFEGKTYHPGADSHWKCTPEGLRRLAELGRIAVEGNSLRYVRFLNDFAAVQIGNMWTDVGGIQSRSDPKVYAVQTSATVLAR